MAQHNAIELLTKRAEGLTLNSITENYPNAHPESNPLDLYRAHLSNVLAEVSGVDRAIIYPVISWTQVLEKGDFVIAIPALRIKGTKPDVLGKEWEAKVRTHDSQLQLFDC